jgi:hypothetical protein
MDNTQSVAVGNSSTSQQWGAAQANSTGGVAVGYNAVAQKAGDVATEQQAQTSATPGTQSLALKVGGSVQAAAAGASDAYLQVSIKGVTYKLLLDM